MTTPYSLTKIRLSTALLSTLLSVFAFYTDDLINRDGILYMDMAAAYLQGGLAATAQLYNWPFFAILVAYIHQYTSFSFELSAQILNSLLFILLTDSLIRIANKILPSKQHLIIAAILFICFQSLNEYRDFIIRDIGYWAFCSLALYHFMLFLEKPSFKRASLWQGFIVLATLFRVEGIIILALLPLYLLLHVSPKVAIKQILQLNFLFIIITVFVSIFTISQPGGAVDAFSKISSILNYFDMNSLLTTLNNKTDILGLQILNKYSERYSTLILISGLIVMLAYKIIQSISFSYIGLYLIGRWREENIYQHKFQRLFIYFIVLNILILITFILNSYFISSRYITMSVLAISLFMLPTLCQLISSIWNCKNKTIIAIIGLVLFIGFIDSLTSSRSKAYIKETAIWASQNITENKSVLTDNQFLQYYFNSNSPHARITKKNSLKMYQNYDYLILVDKQKNQQRALYLSTLNIKFIFSLQDNRGNKASIYSVLTNN